jgi:hypothetical protein
LIVIRQIGHGGEFAADLSKVSPPRHEAGAAKPVGQVLRMSGCRSAITSSSSRKVAFGSIVSPFIAR